MGQQPGRITAGEVTDLLLAALPWLRDSWPDIESEHASPDAPGGRLLNLDAAWVVDRLVDRLAAGDTGGFDAALDLIERLVADGDDDVRQLGVIGYLEGLQMCSGRAVDPRVFRQWLRPHSLRYWSSLDDFWQQGTQTDRARSRGPRRRVSRGGRAAAVR